MKHVACLRWVSNCLPGAFLLAVMAFPPVAAENPAAQTIQNDLTQNTADQAQVRAHTEAVVAEVQGLIDELAANGISGDDAKVLQATKAALANLSGPEMERVIASLKKAGAATNPTDAASNAVHAYTAQKEIVLQFRMILKEYEQREAADELAERFKELTHEQTETMRTTEDVARQTAGRNPIELTTMEQTTQEIVQADQEAIGNEVNLAHDQLDKAVEGSDGDDAKSLLNAQQDMKNGQAQQTLSQANDDLKAGHLLKAISEQTAARDVLRRVTQDLTPPANDAEALAQTATDLAKLIDEQKKLLDQTTSAINAKVMASGLNDQQGVLVDEATLVQEDTQALSAPAADLVKDAINPPMQTSRFQLGDLNGLPVAASAQQVAIAKLEEAQKLLQQELADAEQKDKDAGLAKDNEPAPDPSALTTAAGDLDKAQTDVGNALTDTNPPTTTPPSGSPSPGNPPPGTPPTPPTMPEALQELTDAGNNVASVENTPGLPDSTMAAVTEANKEIAQGKVDASNGDAAGTANEAGAAQTALTRAQATLALAMAGMPGPPAPEPPGPDTLSLNGAEMVTGGSNEKPHLHGVTDSTEKYIPMQNRVRIALGQFALEKCPEEYASQIDQYLKNLADQSSAQ